MICGAWASDGCNHYDEETGDYKPEFMAEVDAMLKAEYEDAAKLLIDLDEEAKLAEEFFKGEKS